jgi:hypothetical protein
MVLKGRLIKVNGESMMAKDAYFWMLDAGCWMLDAGCWMLAYASMQK